VGQIFPPFSRPRLNNWPRSKKSKTPGLNNVHRSLFGFDAKKFRRPIDGSASNEDGAAPSALLHHSSVKNY
jgi:hypothetical protein